MVLHFPPRHIEEVLDYVFDWSDDLGAGETISTRTLTVTGATKDSDSIVGETVKVWISGGIAGTPISIVAKIVTSAGRTFRELGVIPFGEPLSLDQVKQQLNISDDDGTFDILLADLIPAARAYVEGRGNRVLVEREFTEPFTCFHSYLELTRRPVSDVAEVVYTDTDGVEQTIVDHVVTNGRYPIRVYPAYGESWPSSRINTQTLVTYTAGFSEAEWLTNEEAIRLIQAMRLLLATWFTFRETAQGGNLAEVPHGVDALCDSVRGALL